MYSSSVAAFGACGQHWIYQHDKPSALMSFALEIKGNRGFQKNSKNNTSPQPTILFQKVGFRSLVDDG